MERSNEEKACKNSSKCPIYSGVLKGMNFTTAAYKEKYCDGGSDGWSRCRRYQVKERTGKCPENILPNSLKTVEDIIRQYNLQAPSSEAGNTCKNSPKCPIYSGLLKDLAYTAGAYKQLYCDAGAKGWANCRRYQVKERTGKCPENILPNSLKTVEQIAQQYNLQLLS
jgi:hypothetical protein